MESKTNIYCKSAIFRCQCCSYSAEIYSSDEWVEKYDTLICSICKQAYNDHFEIPFIYRSDIDVNIPLHLQEAGIPDKYLCCTACSGKENLHWTELLVACPYCKNGFTSMPNTMIFEKYVIGRHILAFYELCCEKKKLSHPLLEFIDSNGHLYYGPFSEFSAS